MISNPALTGRRRTETGRVIVAVPDREGRWRAHLAPASGCPCRRGSSRPTLLSASIGAAAGALWRCEARPGPGRLGDPLRFPDGATIEADADDDLALFYTESP